MMHPQDIIGSHINNQKAVGGYKHQGISSGRYKKETQLLK
jgi:hypothetical protein